ncbi:outer membrane lipoprotein carrier protein LolA [Halobacteriovorax sp. GB3]|uniref:LolA family protein n=1 Tax=Halobacteriovorax sp. GB3 TaxID=2719615 RepID=UPI002361807A|nr:outer membrane lipoprotein carrier protein LolA [Halobacteriovorax sp. GB3]MDD0854437.1 outer membrane lipoprotein carrier protein LolA [Halobacteriovorax sp. GB3]
MTKLIIATFLLSFDVLAFMPKSFEANFKQENISKRKRRSRRAAPKIIEGKVQYKFPGHIRFDVTSKDNKLTYVSNNKTTWYYTPAYTEKEQGQVTIQTAKANPLHLLFDVLKNGLKSNEFYNVKIDGEKAHLTFSKDFSSKLDIATAEITFKEKKEFSHIQKIDLSYSRGKVVSFQFGGIKENVGLSSDVFNFKIPKNTKQIHR